MYVNSVCMSNLTVPGAFGQLDNDRKQISKKTL